MSLARGRRLSCMPVPPASDARPQIAVVAVLECGREHVVTRVPAEPVDLALVDRLARIAVMFCRCGWRMRLRDVPGELHGLLELCGLAETLGAEPPAPGADPHA